MSAVRSSQRGDMLAQIFVVTPKNLSKKQKELMKELEKEFGEADDDYNKGDDDYKETEGDEDDDNKSSGFFSKVKNLW